MDLIKLSYSKDKILIYTSYNKNFISNIKKVRGAIFNRSSKTWIIPFSEYLKNKKLFNHFKIDISEEDYQIALDIEKNRRNSINNITYNRIDRKFEFNFKYDPTIVKEINKFATWDKSNKIWYSPLKNRDIIENYIKNKKRFIKNYDQKVVNEAFNQLKKEEKLLKASNAIDAQIKIDGLNPAFELMGFQKAGVKYAAEAKTGVMIADEMGLGKTIQGIATVVYKKTFPAVIIVPASLKINWQKEFEKWVPGITTNVVDRKKSSHRFDTDVVIINYDIVNKFLDELKKVNFKSMVIDESHYLKNKDTKRTQSVLALSKDIETKILLSGTPMLNRPIELASQLEIMGVLDNLFGGHEAFIERYCNPKLIRIGKKRVWDYNGSSNLKELNQILRANCYIRREKKDVLKDLPKKTVSVVSLELDNKTKKEYKKAVTDLGKWAAEQLLQNQEFIDMLNEKFPPGMEQEREEFIKKAMKRKEIITNQNEALLRVSALRKLSVQGKMNGIKEWVRNVLESDEKLVLFGVHIEFIEELYREFAEYNPVMVTGKTPNVKRDEAVELFQHDESCRLFIGSIKAAGVGLTLTRANQLACFEFEWRPGDMDQMEARVDRYGQTKPVNIYYLMTPYGIDVEMYKMLKNKDNIVHQGVVGADKIDVNNLLANLVESSFYDELKKCEEVESITR